MENKKIILKSTTKGTVNLYDPYNHLDITWDKKNAKRTLDLDKLKEVIWTPGVSNLFTDGYLVIENPDAFKIMQELGLEDESAETPQLVILTDAQRKRLMTTAPLAEFKETYKTLNYEQRLQLAEFAIENKLIDYDKAKIIKETVGTDIIKAIELNDGADDE